MAFKNMTSGNNDPNNPNNPNDPNNSGGFFGGAAFGGGMIIPQVPTNNDDPTQYLINYNEKFKDSDPALFRDEIIEQTMGVLLGKEKPNALLIGSAGVGKTKIAEDLARRLANDDPTLPDTLLKSVIYELPLSNIVAGSGVVGDVEQKIKSVLDFASDKSNNVVLFIDEIHQLLGDSQTYQKIAQILKPALARGDIRVIGATTLQESNSLMNDPAFNRRFSRLIVDELTREQTITILQHVKPSFITHYKHKVAIPDDILTTVAVIADQYATSGTHRPDGAITILDRACGEAIVARKTLEQKAKHDPVILAAIQASTIIPITEKQIRQTAIRLMTGTNKKETLDIDSLKDHLSVIKGQDNVIEKLTDMIRRDNMGYFKRERPMTLLFAGTSGVGKTEVVKIIARELTGIPPITLNMTEYHSSASINRIIGSPTGYIGSDSNAELPFDKLETNPYQIILLDEFEKGDPSIQRLFMSVFDEGTLKTNRGKTIDFSKCIIVATTNAGFNEKNSTTSRHMGFVDTNSIGNKKSELIDTLSGWFDIALINRFNDTLTFNELTRENYKEIVASQYHTEITRIKSEHRRVTLPDFMPDEDLEKIADETYVRAFGARPARNAVQHYIETNI